MVPPLGDMSSSSSQQQTGLSREQRIPSTLQAVFLRSNRGESLPNKAPPNQIAQRTFAQNWSYQRNRTESSTNKKVYNKDNDKVLRKGILKQSKEDEQQQHEPELYDVPKAYVDTLIETIVASAPPQTTPPPTEFTLQEYFDALIKERGLMPEVLYDTLATGYARKATPWQTASYGPRMVQIVRESNVHALRETLAFGLSPNPCNQFGESLLHMICRRGDAALLQVMIEAGSSVQVADDFGRTPLHDAFWAANPAFGVVETLLKRDAGMLFLRDKRGDRPLNYVPKTHWSEWMEWFDQNVDNFFPQQPLNGSGCGMFQMSDLVWEMPNSFRIPDPKSDLGLELIQMVANGGLSPREARLMAETAHQEDETTVADSYLNEDDDSFCSEDDSDSDYDSDDDDDYDSDEDDDEEEMMMDPGDMAEMIRMAEASRRSGAAYHKMR